MKIELGNANAVDVTYNEIGEMVFSNLDGERVTTFIIPDDHSVMDAFQAVLAGLPRLINPTARPYWVESDNESLQTLLLDHFGLERSTARPSVWGDGSTTRPKEAVAKKVATNKSSAKKEGGQ